MTTTTNILDVLPDGTITKVSFSVPLIIGLTVSRDNLEVPFIITSCDVWSKDEYELSEATAAIQNTM